MNWKNDIRDNHIIVDSCIIEYLFSNITELRQKTHDLLDILKSQNNKLYISSYTQFEVMRGLENEEKLKKLEETLNDFIQVPLEEKRLLNAARLYTKIKNNPGTKPFLQNKSISDGDILIGSLLMNRVKPKLLTADFEGFPRPFFHEYGVERVEYRRKNRLTALYIYCLEANTEEIT